MLAFATMVSSPIVGAQDAFCEDDPLVFVEADNGQQFVLHLWFRVALRLPNGTMVSHEAMKRHLETKSTYKVDKAKLENGTYNITVKIELAPWSDGTPVPFTAWLKDDVTAAGSPTVQGTSGKTTTLAIGIAASTLDASTKPKKTSKGEAICTSALTGIHQNVIVPAGASCLLQTAMVQNVKVEAGGKLRAYKSLIDGNLDANDAAQVRLNLPGGGPMTAVEVRGNVNLINLRATPADLPNGICDRVAIDGSLTVSGNRSELAIGDSQYCASGNMIFGNLKIEKNSGPVVLGDNDIHGNLQCANNTVAPVLRGPTNVVYGKKEGQCRAF